MLHCWDNIPKSYIIRPICTCSINEVTEFPVDALRLDTAAFMDHDFLKEVQDCPIWGGWLRYREYTGVEGLHSSE